MRQNIYSKHSYPHIRLHDNTDEHNVPSKIFSPEDGSRTFLRNTGMHIKQWTVSYSEKEWSYITNRDVRQKNMVMSPPAGLEPSPRFVIGRCQVQISAGSVAILTNTSVTSVRCSSQVPWSQPKAVFLSCVHWNFSYSNISAQYCRCSDETSCTILSDKQVTTKNVWQNKINPRPTQG
jgi:hypothetical protein